MMAWVHDSLLAKQKRKKKTLSYSSNFRFVPAHVHSLQAIFLRSNICLDPCAITHETSSFSFPVTCWTPLNQIMQGDFFFISLCFLTKCLSCWAGNEAIIIVYNISRPVKTCFRCILRGAVQRWTRGCTYCHRHWGGGCQALEQQGEGCCCFIRFV